jgi:flagellar motility protein MotE (MotC chaperone)
MRPEPAARVVEKLDDQMAVEIFKLMQGRLAGKVMANLNPQQAARIGALLTKDKESKKAARLAREAAEAATGPERN